MTRKPGVDIPVPGELAEAIRRAAARLPQHPHDVAQAYRRHRARRRQVVATSAAVVCAVTAAVAGPVLLLKPQPDPVAQPDPVRVPATTALQAAAAATVDIHAADRPDFFFTIAAGPLAGYQIRPSSVTRDHQVAVVVPAAGNEPVASVVLYRPGAAERVVPDVHFEPGPEPNAQVNGSPAFVAVTGQGSAVQWEYAPAGVAVLSSTAGAPESTLLALAEAVRFVDPYPIRVPFRLDYVPADLSLSNVSADSSMRAAIVQLFTDSDDHPGGLDVTIPAPRFPGSEAWDWQPATLAGRAGQCVDLIDGRRCEVAYGNVVVGIGGSLTAAEFERIVAGLHLADLADPATWYDIDDAVPNL